MADSHFGLNTVICQKKHVEIEDNHIALLLQPKKYLWLQMISVFTLN